MITTVSTTEVLLQLIYLYAGLDKRPMKVSELWDKIREFKKILSNDQFFGFYKDEERPSPQFLGDVSELLREDFVKLENGLLVITPVGYVLSGARELPSELKPLGELVEKM